MPTSLSITLPSPRQQPCPAPSPQQQPSPCRGGMETEPGQDPSRDGAERRRGKPEKGKTAILERIRCINIKYLGLLLPKGICFQPLRESEHL